MQKEFRMAMTAAVLFLLAGDHFDPSSTEAGVAGAGSCDLEDYTTDSITATYSFRCCQR